jgi:hypothetical protein
MKRMNRERGFIILSTDWPVRKMEEFKGGPKRWSTYFILILVGEVEE